MTEKFSSDEIRTAFDIVIKLGFITEEEIQNTLSSKKTTTKNHLGYQTLKKQNSDLQEITRTIRSRFWKADNSQQPTKQDILDLLHEHEVKEPILKLLFDPTPLKNAIIHLVFSHHTNYEINILFLLYFQTEILLQNVKTELSRLKINGIGDIHQHTLTTQYHMILEELLERKQQNTDPAPSSHTHTT